MNWRRGEPVPQIVRGLISPANILHVLCITPTDSGYSVYVSQCELCAWAQGERGRRQYWSCREDRTRWSEWQLWSCSRAAGSTHCKTIESQYSAHSLYAVCNFVTDLRHRSFSWRRNNQSSSCEEAHCAPESKTELCVQNRDLGHSWNTHHRFVNGIGRFVGENAGWEAGDDFLDAKLERRLQDIVVHQHVLALQRKWSIKQKFVQCLNRDKNHQKVEVELEVAEQASDHCSEVNNMSGLDAFEQRFCRLPISEQNNRNLTLKSRHTVYKETYMHVHENTLTSSQHLWTTQRRTFRHSESCPAPQPSGSPYPPTPTLQLPTLSSSPTFLSAISKEAFYSIIYNHSCSDQRYHCKIWQLNYIFWMPFC